MRYGILVEIVADASRNGESELGQIFQKTHAALRRRFLVLTESRELNALVGLFDGALHLGNDGFKIALCGNVEFDF